jgi:hypothetical protein
MVSLIDDMINTNLTDIHEFFSNSDTQASFNSAMFSLAKEYYKNRLSVNIIVPKTKEEILKDQTWYKKIASLIPFAKSKKLYENVDLFTDYITTDALDYAITETPIENQFLNEVGTCREEGSLAEKVQLCVTNVEESLDSLGSSLEDKYALIHELESKIALQEKAIEILNGDEELIFVV